MKKTILYTAFALCFAFATSSCEDAFGDYLEKAPSAELEENQVFGDWKRTEYYHNDIYNFLPGGLARINSSWLDSATDLGVTSFAWGGARSSFNVGNYYSGGGQPEIYDSWTHYYTGIRKVNTFLARVDKVPLNPEETDFSRQLLVQRLKSEARFFRAYFYWELAIRYGGVPLITKRLSPYDPELNNIPRETFDNLTQWILSELVDCQGGLTADDAVKSDQTGRITKGADLALRSRINLYLASKRFNQSEDPLKWKQAMDDAWLFINSWGHLAFSPSYKLLTVEIEDKSIAYQRALTLRRVDGNPETIFWRNDGKRDWWRNETPVSFGGFGGLCPSQNLVDMYDMGNGQSPFTQYDQTGAPVYSDTENGTPSGINSLSGYAANKPYSGRDPRFYRTVLFNGSTWWDTPIDTYEGGKDMPVGNGDATPTSYYNRKYMDDSQTHYLNGGSMYRNWTIIRYAEVLLNYVEAKNELSGPDAQIISILDMLRSRVGILVSVASSHPAMDQAAMRRFIRKERTVELCFEEHRIWDLKRWEVAEQALGRPIYGMSITRNEDNSLTYRRVAVQQRVFDAKMYLYPIPQPEVWRTGMANNPGW